MFLSARPERGATFRQFFFTISVNVSIRTPRAGRDKNVSTGSAKLDVSIRTPRAGRDMSERETTLLDIVFLSARPERGATSCKPLQRTMLLFLSARPERGATYVTNAQEWQR